MAHVTYMLQLVCKVGVLKARVLHAAPSSLTPVTRHCTSCTRTGACTAHACVRAHPIWAEAEADPDMTNSAPNQSSDAMMVDSSPQLNVCHVRIEHVVKGTDDVYALKTMQKVEVIDGDLIDQAVPLPI